MWHHHPLMNTFGFCEHLQFRLYTACSHKIKLSPLHREYLVEECYCTPEYLVGEALLMFMEGVVKH